MNILVIIICVIAFILVFFCRVYGLSVIYPTLLIILAIILDILTNTLNSQRRKKEYTNIEEIKNKMKNKNES